MCLRACTQLSWVMRQLHALFSANNVPQWITLGLLQVFIVFQGEQHYVRPLVLGCLQLKRAA